MANDWMPGRRGDQLTMAKTWLVQLPVSYGKWDVTNAVLAELADLVEDVDNALVAQAADKGSEVANARVRQAFTDMIRFMRHIRERSFFTPPMKEADWLRLGMRPPDGIRTDHTVVTEVVEFEISLRNIREILVSFRIKGADHRAKPPGYDGAVVIWDILDSPPSGTTALTQHTMASRTPHAIQFTDEDRGKTVYVALAWQNERGIVGAWSDIKSAVIP